MWLLCVLVNMKVILEVLLFRFLLLLLFLLLLNFFDFWMLVVVFVLLDLLDMMLSFDFELEFGILLIGRDWILGDLFFLIGFFESFFCIVDNIGNDELLCLLLMWFIFFFIVIGMDYFLFRSIGICLWWFLYCCDIFG